MKKHIFMISILLSVAFFACGCSGRGSDAAYVRLTDAEADAIKFLGIEWLSDKETVLKAMGESYDFDQSKVELTFSDGKQNVYSIKSDNGSLGKLADQYDIDRIELTFVGHGNDEKFVIGDCFVQGSYNDIKELYDKLQGQYDCAVDGASLFQLKDENGNIIRITHNEKDWMVCYGLNIEEIDNMKKAVK